MTEFYSNINTCTFSIEHRNCFGFKLRTFWWRWNYHSHRKLHHIHTIELWLFGTYPRVHRDIPRIRHSRHRSWSYSRPRTTLGHTSRRHTGPHLQNDPPKNYKNLFTWNKKVMIISSTLGITACKLNWLNEEVFLKKKKGTFQNRRIRMCLI